MTWLWGISQQLLCLALKRCRPHLSLLPWPRPHPCSLHPEPVHPASSLFVLLPGMSILAWPPPARCLAYLGTAALFCLQKVVSPLATEPHFLQTFLVYNWHDLHGEKDFMVDSSFPSVEHFTWWNTSCCLFFFLMTGDAVI